MRMNEIGPVTRKTSNTMQGLYDRCQPSFKAIAPNITANIAEPPLTEKNSFDLFAIAGLTRIEGTPRNDD